MWIEEKKDEKLKNEEREKKTRLDGSFKRVVGLMIDACFLRSFPYRGRSPFSLFSLFSSSSPLGDRLANHIRQPPLRHALFL